jgi:hypothetical protein
MYTAVPGAKCPWGELSVGRNVRGAKCRGASCRGASCRGASCRGRVVVGRVVLVRVVREPSCTLSPRQYKPPVEQ